MSWKIIVALFAFLLLGFDSFPQEAASVDSLEIEIPNKEDTAYVLFKGDTLFRINSNLGPYSSAERAELIGRHLDFLTKEIEFLEDSFNIVHKTTHSIILYKNFIIMGVC